LTPLSFTVSDDRVRSPQPREREKRDSGFVDPRSSRKDVREVLPNLHQNSAPQTTDPRLNSINVVWLESRCFHPVLSDPALAVLQIVFDLSSVPP
jgi:hypothetical protein